MSWLVSLLSALLCGGAGLGLGGLIANACVTWYHVSGFEGGSGYFVVLMALLGGITGFALGLVASRIVAAAGGSGAALVGIPLAGVVALAVIITSIAWLLGDVPPKLRGERINLVLDVRAPDGWTPSNRIRAGGNWMTLSSVAASGVTRHSSGDPIDFSRTRVEDDAWMIPMETEVFTMKGHRLVTMVLGGKDAASFVVPLPARPDASYEAWSDWLPDRNDAASNGFRYRFRVRPSVEVVREREMAAITASDALRKRFDALSPDDPLDAWVPFLEPGTSPDMMGRASEIIRQRPDEYLALLASPDPEVVSAALNAFHLFYPPPDGAESALRVALAGLGTDVRAWHATLDPSDPDLVAAERLKARYASWRWEWDRLVYHTSPPMAPELLELADLLTSIAETPGAKESTEIYALTNMVTDDIERWQSSDVPVE